MRNISNEVIGNASQQESYKRYLQKQRSVNSIRKLPAPTSLKAWEIPEDLRYIMLYDSGVTLGEDHRFILLGTEEDLRKLALCEIIFSDGTFKVPDFYQVSDDFSFFKKRPNFSLLVALPFQKLSETYFVIKINFT